MSTWLDIRSEGTAQTRLYTHAKDVARLRGVDCYSIEQMTSHGVATGPRYAGALVFPDGAVRDVSNALYWPKYPYATYGGHTTLVAFNGAARTGALTTVTNFGAAARLVLLTVVRTELARISSTGGVTYPQVVPSAVARWNQYALADVVHSAPYLVGKAHDSMTRDVISDIEKQTVFAAGAGCTRLDEVLQLRNTAYLAPRAMAIALAQRMQRRVTLKHTRDDLLAHGDSPEYVASVVDGAPVGTLEPYWRALSLLVTDAILTINESGER